ncbi:hypothetical protein EfmAA96_01020 [Enterococcus faecium]|nr:hypothetical protein EfmAA96_01020 [Enterococcus faecium]
MQLFILLFLIFLTRKSHFSDNSGDKQKLCCNAKKILADAGVSEDVRVRITFVIKRFILCNVLFY